MMLKRSISLSPYGAIVSAKTAIRVIEDDQNESKHGQLRFSKPGDGDLPRGTNRAIGKIRRECRQSVVGRLGGTSRRADGGGART